MSIKKKYCCDADGCSYGYRRNDTEDPVGDGWLIAAETGKGHTIILAKFSSPDFDVELSGYEVTHLCGWSCFQKWAEKKLEPSSTDIAL